MVSVARTRQFPGMSTIFQRDNLRRHFRVRVLHAQPGSLVSVGYVWVAGAFITKMKTSIPQDWIDYSNSRKVTSSGDYHFSSDIHRSWRPRLIGPDSCESCYT